MDTPFPIEMIGVGIAVLCGAALLGYVLQKGCGVVLLLVVASLACGLCLVGAMLGQWIGLLIAILVVGGLAIVVGNKLGGQRAARVIALIWLAFCLSCVIGYWIGGQIGLLAVTLPSNLLFWVVLYMLSGYLLPLKDGSRTQAFRSILTFSLGTNYPYLVMKDRKLEKRVDGNPYKAFLSGPGLVLTGCDHAAVLTNGSHIKPPEAPGLTFTGRFEIVQSIIDLRPQLRAFPVEARTLDGISIRVLTFVPFRIEWDGQEPVLGQSYPFQKEAILQAITSEIVEPEDRKHSWDTLVEIQAARIVRDIISHYRFDDLCLAMSPLTGGDDDILLRYQADDHPSPHDPDRDPRYRIRDELVARIKQEMKPYGIEVIGGGISNLAPVEDHVTELRIENWRTRMQTRIDVAHAEGEATRAEIVETAKHEVEQRLLVIMTEMLEESIAQGQQVSDAMLAATLVASLERMAENQKVRDQLPLDTRQRLAYLRSQGKSGSMGKGPGG
jgi:hypothetical protein